jgi:hypothetical protein
VTTVPEHIRSIQIRIETIAETESRPGETGVTLEKTLAALTEPGRRRVKMLLDHINATSHDAQERKAADLIRRRAHEFGTGRASALWEALGSGWCHHRLARG